MHTPQSARWTWLQFRTPLSSAKITDRFLPAGNFFDKRLADANSIVLVYLDDEKIVGCIIGKFIRENIIKKTDEVQIETVYVIERYRGRKIGTKLIETAPIFSSSGIYTFAFSTKSSIVYLV